MPKVQKIKEDRREISVEIVVNATPAESCFERLREVYAICKAAHAECYAAMQMVRQRQLNMKLPEMVDCQFALRESAVLADDLRKELKKLQDTLAKLTCGIWAIDPMSNATIEGEYCNGHPELKVRTNIPSFKKDPIAYKALMDWLGIPDDLQDRGKILCEEGEFETEVVKLDWNGFQDYFTRVMAAGYPLPPGIAQEDTWEEATVKCTRKHDLL